VTFTFKDYRIEGPGRYKTMTLAAEEFIRRFLIHVLPKGFHRIRQNFYEIKCLSSQCTFAPPFIPLFLKTAKFTLANPSAGVTCALHNGVFWRIAANLLSPNLCN
jgi:Putative transposase